MSDEPPTSEPASNIGTGEQISDIEHRHAETRAEAVIDRLGDLYWQKTYGTKDAFSCLVRTILSQNTSDVVSQPAYDALCEKCEATDDFATCLENLSKDTIAETIRPAGLHNQKATVLKTAAAVIRNEWDSAADFDHFVSNADRQTVRNRLLSISGVGPKTADCVLLFAGGKPGVFPVDTHVHRVARRLGIVPVSADEEGVRETLEATVPPKKCGFGHTSMIQFGREYCTASTPACIDCDTTCPLEDLCDQHGINTATNTVTDPAESASTTE